MTPKRTLRTLDDLRRVVRALAYEFKTDTVFVVGSQAILAAMPDAPDATKASPEIDAFPANAKLWELAESRPTRHGVIPSASEHIDGLFGEGSQFHTAHGFYIDGVDETTAKLPRGWQSRAISVDTEVENRRVVGIVPAVEDIVVSKIARLDERDKEFVEALHGQRPLDLDLITRRIHQTHLDPAVAERAIGYIASLRHKEKKLDPKP